MRFSRRSKTTAFTLVELLVVIGIIALLIGILLPVMGRVRDKGRTISCAANERSILQALFIYAAENRGSLPYGFIYEHMDLAPGTRTGDSQDPPTQAFSYMWESCANARMKKMDAMDRFRGRFHDAFKCPEGKTRDGFPQPIHYAVNPVAMPDLRREIKGPIGTTEELDRDLIKPARLSDLFVDNALIWDQPLFYPGNDPAFVADAENQPGFFYSYVDDGMLLTPTSPEFRYRRADGDPFAGINGYKNDGSIRSSPKITDYGGGNVDSTRGDGSVFVRDIGTPRWRHGSSTICNVGFADGSVQSLQWNPKKFETGPLVGPLGATAVQTPVSDFKRRMLRIKWPKNRKPTWEE